MTSWQPGPATAVCEDRLLPISALNDIPFRGRRWAMTGVGQMGVGNVHTTEKA